MDQNLQPNNQKENKNNINEPSVPPLKPSVDFSPQKNFSENLVAPSPKSVSPADSNKVSPLSAGPAAEKSSPVSPVSEKNQSPTINMVTQHSGQQYKLASAEVQGPKPPLVAQRGSKFALIAIGMVLIGVFGIGGYYFYVKDNVPKPISSPAITPIKTIPVVDKTLDSDKDGLPDSIEKILGTYMTKSDTDGDGYNDLSEIKNGYSPLIAGNAGKFSEEEWNQVKEKIKIENRDFYEREIETQATPSPEPSPSVTAVPESSPESTFNNYLNAVQAKDLALFFQTIDKESVKKIEEDPSYSGTRDVNKWDSMQFKMWSDAKYAVSEKTDKYSIMTPAVREQNNGTSSVSVPNVYFIYEDNLWKIDFIMTLRDTMIRVLPQSQESLSEGKDVEAEINDAVNEWKASFNK